MNIIQFAIAREAGRLMQERAARELTARENNLLRALQPVVERIRAKEAPPETREVQP